MFQCNNLYLYIIFVTYTRKCISILVFFIHLWWGGEQLTALHTFAICAISAFFRTRPVRREPKPFPLALPSSPLITALSRQSYAREQPRDACKSRCTN